MPPGSIDIEVVATTEPEKMSSLGASARAALKWGSAFLLLRDVLQFVVMLVLVRLIAPEDYGVAALAQSVVGVASILSYQTFSLHTLQMRDPTHVDWQAHFTAAVLINSVAIFLTLLLAWGLNWFETYRSAAAPLAALSSVFLVEIAGTLRHRQLETTHSWSRFRLLLMAGTVLGLGIGLLIGLAGGGVWALVVQPPLFGLPAAIDLFFSGRFRPDWTWNVARYRETIWFGLNRAAALALVRGRYALEQLSLAAIFSFANLGFFSRGFGLATILVGRLGSIAMLSLYPVLTRAEQGSDRFRRLAGLVLSGVCWVSIPVAGYVGIVANELVYLLYGPKWLSVAQLLPFAAAATGLAGITTVLTNLVLANDKKNLALRLEAFVQLSCGATLLLAPVGLVFYLTGLALVYACGAAIATATLLRANGITIDGVRMAFLPPAVATALGVAIALGMLQQISDAGYFVRLLAAGLILAVVFIGVLRIFFREDLLKLVEVLPGGGILEKTMVLRLKK